MCLSILGIRGTSKIFFKINTLYKREDRETVLEKPRAEL
jgi:hypothetical protein